MLLSLNYEVLTLGKSTKFPKYCEGRKSLILNNKNLQTVIACLCLGIGFLISTTISAEAKKPLNDKPKRKGLLLQADDPDDARRWAIVIGVNDYNDVAIGKLSKARNDAKIIGQLLMEQGEFGKVFVMTDDVDAKNTLYPTRINIEEKLDIILSSAEKNDTILFFFSGHGVSDSKGEGYILPVDTVFDKVTYSAIKVNNIIGKINEKGIKKSLLILDACRDVITSTKGNQKEGLQSDKFAKAEVAATFFSTKSGYYSFEDPKSDFGVFTKYLAYGMEGKADSNNDGIVSFGELEYYVQVGVNEWSLGNNKQQKPFVKYYKEKYGDLPISVKGSRTKSLVEENNYNKTKMKMSYVWRSAIVPGFGQYVAGEKWRGGSYFVLGLGFLANFLTHQKEFNSAQSAYNSAYAIPGSSFFPMYFNQQNKKSDLHSAEVSLQSAYFLLIGFWLWNIFDAAVLTEAEKPKEGIGFHFYREPIQTMTNAKNLPEYKLENKAVLEFTIHF